MPNELYNLYYKQRLRERFAREGVAEDQLDIRVAESLAKEGIPDPTRQPTTPPGFWKGTVATAVKSPLSYLAGANIDTPVGIAKGVGSIGANVLQATAPAMETPEGAVVVPVPGATQAPTTDPGERLVNLATSVLPADAYKQRYRDVVLKHGRSANFEEEVVRKTIAGFNTIMMDVLPGQQVSELLRGEKDVGQTPLGVPIRRPLTAREVGQNVSSAALQMLPVVGLLGKLYRFGAAKPPPPSLSSTRSVGEIAAFRQKMKDFREPAPIPPAESVANAAAALDDPTFARDVFSGAHRFTPEVLDNIYYDVVRSGVSANILEDISRGTHNWQRLYLTMAESVERGALTPDLTRRLVVDHNLSPELASKRIAEVLREQSKLAGKELQTLSAVSGLQEAEILERAIKGDPAAARLYRLLQEGAAPPTAFGIMHDIMREYQSTRMSAAISRINTAARNFAVAGIGGSILQVFENAVSGTIEALARAPRPHGTSHYADLMGNFTALAHQMPGLRGRLNAVLDALPETKGRLFSQSQFDIARDMATAAGAPKTAAATAGGRVKQGLQTTRDWLTFFNRIQEIEARRFFFTSRLMGNLDEMAPHVKNFVQLMDELRKPELDEGVRLALADAEHHALKQTFAARPEWTFANGVLDMYHKYPVLHSLGPTFPRYMFNSWRWQIEHSPTAWLQIFNPEFRKTLMSASNEGLASRNAARSLGQATSGMALLNAGWALRSSEHAGPKYYQVWTGKYDEQGSKVYDDYRAYAPPVGALFLADVAKSIHSGTPLNMTNDEILDGLTGVRAIAETPMFGFAESLLQLDAKDPDLRSKILRAPLGREFSAFFVPVQQVQEVLGIGVAAYERAMGKTPELSQELLAQRNVYGRELTGPIASKIPGLSSQIPKRVDPFTGGSRLEEVPSKRIIAGITSQSLTKFQELVTETPGINLGSLVSGHYTAEANNLVAKHLGSLLNRKGPGDVPIGDYIATRVREARLRPADQEDMLRRVLNIFRNVARSQAMAEDRTAFKTYFERERVSPLIQRMLENRDAVEELQKQGLLPKGMP